MNAAISTFRTRTKPQVLIEAPVDTRTPLIRRIDAIQAMSERPRLKPVGAPRIDTDPEYWKRAYRRFLKHELRPTCTTCRGTGEITVSDGYGCVDFDLCPRCGYVEPFNESDFDPIPF